MEWTTVARPGQFGKRKARLEADWNHKYGPDGWRVAYEWGPNTVDRSLALQFYEDAYVGFFERNPDQMEWLTRNFRDVYDTDPSNVAAGTDYSIQTTPNNHVHDVSIRRAVLRLGRSFEGEGLLHVRSKSTEGRHLSPGMLPFHLPHMISDEPMDDEDQMRIWWNSGSIEDFYQRNKVVQARD